MGKWVVSEGGLEPPCPLRALAPQASASAYSATRTRDARGTHRLSYLSKPNAPRRVPRPVNLTTRRRSSPSIPLAIMPGPAPRQPCPGPALLILYGCRVRVVPARRRLAQADHRGGARAGTGLTPDARAFPAHSRDRRIPHPLRTPAHSYGVDVPAMSLQLHECDIHAV